jgi:hypothetical protein
MRGVPDPRYDESFANRSVRVAHDLVVSRHPKAVDPILDYPRLYVPPPRLSVCAVRLAQARKMVGRGRDPDAGRGVPAELKDTDRFSHSRSCSPPKFSQHLIQNIV